MPQYLPIVVVDAKTLKPIQGAAVTTTLTPDQCPCTCEAPLLGCMNSGCGCNEACSQPPTWQDQGQTDSSGTWLIALSGNAPIAYAGQATADGYSSGSYSGEIPSCFSGYNPPAHAKTVYLVANPLGTNATQGVFGLGSFETALTWMLSGQGYQNTQDQGLVGAFGALPGDVLLALVIIIIGVVAVSIVIALVVFT